MWTFGSVLSRLSQGKELALWPDGTVPQHVPSKWCASLALAWYDPAALRDGPALGHMVPKERLAAASVSLMMSSASDRLAMGARRIFEAEKAVKHAEAGTESCG